MSPLLETISIFGVGFLTSAVVIIASLVIATPRRKY